MGGTRPDGLACPGSLHHFFASSFNQRYPINEGTCSQSNEVYYLSSCFRRLSHDSYISVMWLPTWWSNQHYVVYFLLFWFVLFVHFACIIQIKSASMAGSWERTVESVRFNGLRTVCTVSCWVVTATLAYFLWVKPSQDQQVFLLILNISFCLLVLIRIFYFLLFNF